MPIWLLTLLPKLPVILWHGVKRFSSVILIGLLVILPIIALHQYGDRHDKEGYARGYAQATKDNPTQVFGDNANVSNNRNGQNPILDMGIYKLRIGAYWKP